MTRTCAGFIVVRLPSWDEESYRAEPYRDKAYRGIERASWECLRLRDRVWGSYLPDGEPLPRSLVPSYEALVELNEDFTSWMLTPDLKVARRFRNFVNRPARRSEILSIDWPRAGERKGITVALPPSAIFLGWDAAVLSAWSIVREGLFPSRDAHRVPWLEKLNPDGLFTTAEDARAYADWYVPASRENIVEPLADDALIDPVGIYVVE